MRYEFGGNNFPYVEFFLDSGEVILCPDGSPSWMSANMEKTTVGGLFSRSFSGTTGSLNRFTAIGQQGAIALCSGVPGEIRFFEISSEKEILIQKESLVAATENVEVSVAFRKKLGKGYFGGEGLTYLKLSGKGTVFVRVEGSCVEKSLREEEQILTDSGHLLAFDRSCSFKVTGAGGLKKSVFGEKTQFSVKVKGPGTLILQSMPACQSAKVLYPHLIGMDQT